MAQDAAGAATATTGTPTLQTVSLDGHDWLLAADASDVGWRDRWWAQPRPEAAPARVPWVIQDTLPGYHGVAWYWYVFTPPPNPNPRGRYLLRFRAVNYKADVWVNDGYVGGHEGGEMPFTLDVTDRVRGGEPARLAVRVVDPRYDVRIDGFNRYETPRRGGPAMQHGGIEDSVELIVAPAARLADVFAKPNWKTGEIDLEVTATNAIDRRVAATLRISVARDKHDETLNEATLELTLAPGETLVTTKLKVESPALWDLDTPSLYRVTATLELHGDAGPAADALSFRVGFRDFRFEDGVFRLNGRRIYLRSVPQSNFDPIGFWLPYDHGTTPDLFQRRLVMAKEMGFNMVRVHRAAARRNLLDFADELGIMIYEECFATSRFNASPQQAQRMRDNYRELICRDRNHASVTVWGLLNEIYVREPQFWHAVESLPLVRSLDPTRVVLLNSGRWDYLPHIGSICNPGETAWQHLLGNERPDAPTVGKTLEYTATEARPDQEKHKDDVGDVHHYVGFPMEPKSTDLFRYLGHHADKPTILTEFGVGSGVDLVTLWEHFEKHRATHLESAQYTRVMLELFMHDWETWKLGETFESPKHFFHASMARSGPNRLDLLNPVRANAKIVALSHVSLSERPMIGQGLVTMYGELKPGAKEAMLDGLAPVRFCLLPEPYSLYRGGTVRLDAVLANDGALPPGDYAFDLELRRDDGHVAWQKRATISVAAEGPFAQPVHSETIAVTAEAGAYRFTARFADGRAVPGGETTIYVFDKQQMPPVRREVVLWGEDDALRHWLEANGIKCRAFDAVWQDRRELIVASEAAPAPGGRAAFEDLVRRIARGSAVLFLSEKVFADGKEPTRWLPLPEKGVMVKTFNWLFGKDEWVKEHPIFAGLQSGGLMDYHFYRDTLRTAQPVLSGATAPETAIAGGIATSSFQTEIGVYHSGLMLAEHALGAGRFVFNTLPIREALLANVPQAERLLRNILNHLARDLDAPPSRVPADFDATLARLYAEPPGHAPAIQIIVPHDGAVLKASATISINIRTAQIASKVERIEFFANGERIGEDKVRKPDPSTYSFIWSGVPRGEYAITARATDNHGRTSESQTVRVRVQ